MHKHKRDKPQERPKFLDEIGRQRMWRNFVVALLGIYLHCDVQIAASTPLYFIVYLFYIFVCMCIFYVLPLGVINDGDNVYFWLLNANSPMWIYFLMKCWQNENNDVVGSRFLGELMDCSNEPDMIADTFLNNVRMIALLSIFSFTALFNHSYSFLSIWQNAGLFCSRIKQIK